jgi:hypothetical protein
VRTSQAGAIAGLALLAFAPLPIATAISAAATPVAPSTLGVDEIDDTVNGTVEKSTSTLDDTIDEVLPAEPEPEQPVRVPEAPLPEPDTAEDAPKVVPPKPQLPKPPTTALPKPAPAPAPVPTGDKSSGSESDSDPLSGDGDGRSAGSGAGGTDRTGLGPTRVGEPRGAEFAGSGRSSSSIFYSGASPLLPEANAGDPNIRSLLIAGGQRSEAISPVGDDTAGSVTGLLTLGALASLMLYGSAAYLKYGKRRPATGKHKA